MTTAEKTTDGQDQQDEIPPSRGADHQDAERNQSNTDISADENNGIQVGKARDITYNNWYCTSEPERAVDRMLADATWHHAQNHFAPHDGLSQVTDALSEQHLVFLHSEGTGREFGGVRMLLDLGVKQIAHLNERKPFNSLRSADLEANHGYLWSGVDRQWQKAIGSGAVHRLADHARRSGAYIVVLLDDKVALGAGLRKFEHHLTAPDPVDVATKTLQAKGYSAAIISHDDDFLVHLSDGTSPDQAVDVATKAQQTHDGKLHRESTLAYLQANAEQAVRNWFSAEKAAESDLSARTPGSHRSGRSTIECAMLLAIAVFEHHDYNDVVESGKTLERMIAEADARDDQSLEPRKIFEFSKSGLLDNLQAEVALHRLYEDVDLHKETVHFRRSSWSQAAFRIVWDEFDLIRPVVVDWMTQHLRITDSSQWYCAKALHDVTVNVPSRDPLQHVDTLAANSSSVARQLAAEVLGRLAEDEGTQSEAERTLQDWCSRTKEHYRKETATRVYATDYGQRDPTRALDQMEPIIEKDARLHNAVKAAVMSLLDRPDNRSLLLERLHAWTKPFPLGKADEQQRVNLRNVGLECAQAALGLLPGTRYLRSLPVKTVHDPPGDPDAALVARLFRRVFQDYRTSKSALRTLFDFGDHCAQHPDGDAAKGLVQLLDTVAPCLHEQAEHPLFRTWSIDFPERSHRIHRLFEIVQRLQHRHATT